MHKVYLLLRNNKKQGPYSLEELLQQKLKPFDLVWVEGKSVGWKYPTEIDMLKSHVAEPAILETKLPERTAEDKKPEPVYEKEKPLSPQPKPQPLPKPQPQPQSQLIPKLKSRKVFVSLPAGRTSIPPAAEEESFSQKLEKKAEELYQRAQAYAEQKSREKSFGQNEPSKLSSPSKELEIDTKYTRSLEDIKEEYSSWLYEQKRNKKRPVYKTSLTIVATVILLAVGYTAAKIVFQKNDSSEIADQNIPKTDLNQTALTKPGIVANKTSTKSTKKKPVQAIARTPFVNKKKTSTSVAGSKKPAIKPTVKKNNEKQVQLVKKNPVFLPDQVKITGQYAANKKGIPDFNITVKNNSNQRLRFVAVDIFYYRNDGSLAGKKTLYFNKIAPNSIMTLTAPGNSKADDVIFKMGLLSSEKGELYYTKL